MIISKEIDHFLVVHSSTEISTCPWDESDLEIGRVKDRKTMKRNQIQLN